MREPARTSPQQAVQSRQTDVVCVVGVDPQVDDDAVRDESEMAECGFEYRRI